LSVGLLEISDYIDPEDLDALEERLHDYTREETGLTLDFVPLSILKRDEDDDRIVAGLYGESFWNWLYIDSLWVDDALCGQGVGRSLIEAAEEEARARDCTGVYLWAQSFTSPDFYAKMGYEVFAELPGFPVGHRRIGFMKRLLQTSEQAGSR
jgi:N-acetylglutamate synthase-like GNAT family acetyltransferase